jgi:uncharacterized protein YneF (UPF0154 family)
MGTNHLACILIGIALGVFLAKKTKLPLVGGA